MIRTKNSYLIMVMATISAVFAALLNPLATSASLGGDVAFRLSAPIRAKNAGHARNDVEQKPLFDSRNSCAPFVIMSLCGSLFRNQEVFLQSPGGEPRARTCGSC